MILILLLNIAKPNFKFWNWLPILTDSRVVRNCSFGFDIDISASQPFITKPISISILGMADFETNTDINMEWKPISKSISISIFGESSFRNQYQYQYSKHAYFEPISISISIFSILKPIFYYKRIAKKAQQRSKITISMSIL